MNVHEASRARAMADHGATALAEITAFIEARQFESALAVVTRAIPAFQQYRAELGQVTTVLHELPVSE